MSESVAHSSSGLLESYIPQTENVPLVTWLGVCMHSWTVGVGWA